MHRIILFVFLFISVCSYGQKGFYAGFSASGGLSFVANQNLYGLKWTHLNKDKKFDPAHKSTLGYGGNLKLGYNFSPAIGLQWEGGYQKRGQRYEDTDGKELTHSKEMDFNYINTGIYFRYTSIFRRNFYKKEQKLRLAITFGPQFNILLTANQFYSLEGETLDLLNLTFQDIDYPSNNVPFWESDYNFSNSENDKALFSNYDIGLLGRIGLDIYPKPWFFLSPTLTSYLSLTDINNKKFTQHDGYGQTRNFFLGLELGVGFYFDK